MEGGAVGHNFERDPPGTIPARFGLIWFSGFRGENLNVIFYQNMPNLHNRYKSAERKISHLGFPIGIKNTHLIEDLPMIIPGQFGFNYPSGFREEAF